MSSGASIAERLAKLEDIERELWDLRHSLAERLEAVRRRADLFDADTRERVRRLRVLEALATTERLEVDQLVDDALDLVLARRATHDRPGHRATARVAG